MFLVFFIQFLSISFSADCTDASVGVAYGPCEDNNRQLIFYWKEKDCENKFQLPNHIVVSCDYECGLEGEYAGAYFSTTEGECKKCPPGSEPPEYYVLYSKWSSILPDGFEFSPNDGTGWKTDEFGLSTGVQKSGADISFTFSADIVSSYGLFFFYYMGHYNGYDNRVDVYIDGLFKETLNLTGEWNYFWGDVGYGQHSLRVRYRSSPYYEPTSEGLRITVMYVYGSGYLPLSCNLCPPGTYGNVEYGYCYSCYENTFAKESGLVECTPCGDDEYSTWGASECKRKGPCTDDDFYEEYEDCKDGSRTISYHHIYPQLCTGSYQPESRTETCSRCNPGFYHDGSNCVKCPEGTFRNEASSTDTECQQCPEGQASYQTTYFTQADLSSGQETSNFSTSCDAQNIYEEDSYCYYRLENGTWYYHGWESVGNSFISGRYYNGAVQALLSYKANLTWGGSFQFSFSTHIQSTSSFLYWTSTEYGPNMATVVSENVTRQEVTIRADYETTIHFEFDKRGKGFGSDERRLVDYVEIHYIMVNGDQNANGGAVECKPCGAGQSVLEGTSCSLCPKGTASTVEQSTCVPCEGNTYADVEGLEVCLPCGDGSVALDGHEWCVINTCGLTIDNDVYDLTPLSDGVDMFGPVEVRNHPGRFFFSVCNYNNLGNYCRADDDENNNINTLACQLSGNPATPHDLGNLTNITYFSSEDGSLTGINMTFYNGERVYVTGTEYRSSAEILFICLPNSGVGKPIKKSKGEFVTNATYHFQWETEYACRLCREDDYEEFPGDCVKPGKRTYSWVLKNGSVCSHGYEIPPPVVRDCSLPVITMNGGGLAGIIIGAIAVIIIIVLSLVLLIRKNRKLRYQLVQTQTLQAGGLQGGSGVTGMSGLGEGSTYMFKN